MDLTIPETEAIRDALHWVLAHGNFANDDERLLLSALHKINQPA
jgi:hypothetical protein